MDFKKFNRRIYLSSPTMHGEELFYMTEAYTSNWMSTIGENINTIENSICKYIGCEYGVGLSSGTSAIHMAIKAAGVKQGDYVFCSDMTFGATVNPILYEKGIPIFIDTEPDTWNMSPAALKKAFELFPNVKVVIVADLYGVPAKLDEIKIICDEHGAILIEDAAESLGAEYKGKKAASFGDINIISFNGNKIITGSSGGMLLTNDKKISNKVHKWSTQSRENAPWYQHEELGYNYRMSNVIAGVVRGQFIHLQEHIDKKKKIYERYEEGFKDLPVTLNPFIADTMKPNYWLTCLLIDNKAMCKQFRTDKKATYVKEIGKTCPSEIFELLESYNVESRPIWKPMHLQPIYKNNYFVTEEGINTGLDVGADIFNRGICLPSDIKMTAEEQNVVIQIIKNCFC